MVESSFAARPQTNLIAFCDNTRGQPRVLAVEAERLAILLAVMKQITLVALQHRPRDLNRLAQPALQAPVEKETDMHAAIAHRGFRVVAHLGPVEIVGEHGLQRIGGNRLRCALLASAAALTRRRQIDVPLSTATAEYLLCSSGLGARMVR
jgi:hypothetical protein